MTGIRIVRVGSYGDIGEELAAATLQSKLIAQFGNREHATILVNARIPHKFDMQRETDLILIYRYGVVIIEVKNWSGPVEFELQDGCWNNGEYRKDPRRQVLSVKNTVLSFLGDMTAYVAVNSMVWFTSNIIQLTLNSEDKPINFPAPVKKLGAGADYLVTGEVAKRQLAINVTPGRQLTHETIAKIERRILGIRQANYLRTIRNYQILSTINGPLHEEYAAAHIGAQFDLTTPRIRLKRHRLRPIDTEQDLQNWQLHRKESLLSAYRLYDVLDQLDKVPGIPSVRDCFADPDDDTVIWTAYRFVNGPTLQEYCAKLPREKIMHMFSTVAGTLSECHDRKIYHRALTQKSVIVPQNEQNVTPRILGFDFARIEDNSGRPTISNTIYEAVYRSKYADPEIRKNISSATAKSDIYSLGIIFIEILLNKEINSMHPADASAAVNGLARNTAERIRNFLKKMVNEVPVQRPLSMLEVRDFFREPASFT